MNIAVIKDNVCVNVKAFASIETAQSMVGKGFIDADTVAVLPEGFGIGDTYENGQWTAAVKPDTEPVTDPQPVVDVTETIRLKTAEINNACETAVYSGITVDLSVGREHFSLTQNDQMNITGLYEDLLTVLQGQPSNAGIITKDGVLYVPYHQNGAICSYYTADDWNKLVHEMGQQKLYHLTYANVLKQYVKSLTDTAAVSAVTYGMTMPEPYNGHLLYITTGGVNGKLIEVYSDEPQ